MTMKEEEYEQFLDQLYKEAIEMDCVAPKSKLEFIGVHIFDFTTYCGEFDEILSKRMLAVCKAIVEKTTFEFIKPSDEAHLEYITMCNMPFLVDKLSWGTSIRGAWFDDKTYKIDCDNSEVTDINSFVKALIKWSEIC